ncbi:hypothetical protein GN244_ATG14617 [Phytophthora infestans]|uniref:Uncharacterized protein n=1 Tax=Phytophthora infestans TaxID=4787 RepID=A0A833SEX5_PHYIN|nr:hypothetical protein GN244_ATG14617 [Phytophthora infestans]KAF4143039.1 hypothetical protein GN958_ATG07768 [Phytophthora infestans]KAF4144034.1 hypothetical protein GN958_ATG06796 [Phytophthora infestans]KAI9984626.1 hypothetical protein PInf_005986 [Phytophthora infestans]KAI9984656.1 hypothetical protein PInf_006017 [Phytophthora infestans]
MKLLKLLSIVTAVAATVDAGNSGYLRVTKDDSANGATKFVLSDVNQAEQAFTSPCPEKCPLNFQPVKDEDGVVHQNKCIQRLLGCQESNQLSAADFSKIRHFFDSIEGTIELDGSGSAEEVVVTVTSAEVPDKIARNAPTEPKGFPEQLLVKILSGGSSHEGDMSS